MKNIKKDTWDMEKLELQNILKGNIDNTNKSEMLCFNFHEVHKILGFSLNDNKVNFCLFL
jgi:hypothetical protein